MMAAICKKHCPGLIPDAPVDCQTLSPELCRRNFVAELCRRTLSPNFVAETLSPNFVAGTLSPNFVAGTLSPEGTGSV
jgi:hypothetical protein